MINLTTAQEALKNIYLGVVSNQLNINSNPLLNKIKQSTQDVWGNDIIKLAPYGINGGISTGTEYGDLPQASNTKFVQFRSNLKNLYGSLQISDKALRQSQNSSAVFVNLLNSEMEALIKSSNFNLSRMLYGNGSGILTDMPEDSFIEKGKFKVNNVKNIVEGMTIDFVLKDELTVFRTATIVDIDRVNKIVTVSPAETVNYPEYYLTVQGSYGKELTGLGAIFDTTTETLYGVTKANYSWMNPYINENMGVISDEKIQEAIDQLEEYNGSTIDFIACSSFVKRAYQTYLGTFRRNIDVMELNGGHKAISFNGIPLLSDRFVEDDTMYLLNTKEFTMHQLCDWQWLEGNDGTILRQSQTAPVYNATLVKYADLICDKPNGQAKLSGITGGVSA